MLMISLKQGLQTFLPEGHIGNYTTVWEPDFLRNATVSKYVQPNQ